MLKKPSIFKMNLMHLNAGYHLQVRHILAALVALPLIYVILW